MTSCVSWRRTCIALWIALCVSVAAPSAAQTVGGTLLGTVVDNSGAVLPGATVTATNTATAVARTAISDGQGRYSIADLPPGPYDVNASLSGFQTVLRRGIRLVVGNPSVVDFTLGISGVAETITVSGAAPVVDTVSTAIGTVVEQKQIAELPLVDRSYSRLIVLAPGANEVPPATAGGQFQQFFGRQPQYTVSGARPEGQVFLLDNTNVQNYWNRGSGSGQLGTTLGVEAIAEYQVLTNTYSAQFGGNGVAINAITKSGTNQFHGSLFEYFRDNALDASNYFDQLLGRPDPTLRKNQFGVSHGGPLVANKAFYFFNYEGLRQTQGTTQVITVPDANARNGVINGVRVGVNAAIAPVLALYPAATRQTAAQAAQGVGQTDVINSVHGPRELLRRPRRLHGDEPHVAVRALHGRHRVGRRAELRLADSAVGEQRRHRQSLSDGGSASTSCGRRCSTACASVSHVPQEAATRTDLDNGLLTFFPGRMDGTVAAGSGVVGLGGNQVLPFTQRQTRYMIADDLGWTRARPCPEDRDRIRTADDVREPAAVRRRLMDVSQSHGISAEPAVAVSRRAARTDGCRQKHRRVAPDHVRTGRMAHQSARDDQSRPSVRSARQSRRSTKGRRLSAARNQLALPRSRRRFSATRRSATGNRGSASHSIRHARIAPPSAPATASSIARSRRTGSGPAFGVNPPFALGVQVRIPIPGVPVPVFPTPNPSASQVSQMQGLDYDITGTPRLQQWNVNVQREILSNTSVTLAYVGSRGDHLQQQRDVNPVLPRTLANGTVVYGARAGTQTTSNARLNPVFAALTTGNTLGTSTYHSLQAALNRRFEQGHSVAGVVHAVALPRHIVRQLALRRRHRRDQPVRPHLR